MSSAGKKMGSNFLVHRHFNKNSDLLNKVGGGGGGECTAE